MEVEVAVVQGSERVLLSVSRDELLLLVGSVNEAIEAVDDWEFPHRLGAEKDAARRLRKNLARVISELPPDRT